MCGVSGAQALETWVELQGIHLGFFAISGGGAQALEERVEPVSVNLGFSQPSCGDAAQGQAGGAQARAWSFRM